VAGCALSFHLYSFNQIYSDWIQASPTLNLVNDYLRFVIAFFEVISASAPHIYHSALPLSPRTSIIHELHKAYARPLVRVVYGISISWEPIVATVRHRDWIGKAAWSPCSRFIAVGLFGRTEVLDAVTLERLHSLTHTPTHYTQWFSFSPDSRSLTQLHGDHGLATWDLQTGGRISHIPSTQDATSSVYFSSAVSMDGKMVAFAYRDPFTTVTGISTYNLLSGTREYSHSVSEGRIVAPIWTYGEFLRFVTVKPGSITIQQVWFGSKHTLAELESLPAPDNVGSGESLFLPTRTQLAFILESAVLVWDARDSKIILNFVGSCKPMGLSFSSDGRFFACGTTGREIHLWKESPTGYVLHQKLVSNSDGERRLSYLSGGGVRPLLSPNGESIITSKYSDTRLWRTTDPITSLSSVPTQPITETTLILGFSPDESLAAVARLGDNMATIIDLRSGDPRLIIDAGTGVCGLGVAGNVIVVVGDGGIITWNLPAEDGVLDARVNINDSVRTIMFNYSTSPPTRLHCASISPNLNCIAIMREGHSSGDVELYRWGAYDLEIYDMSTAKYLAGTPLARPGDSLLFALGEQEVWCVCGVLGLQRWKIVKDTKSDVARLEPLKVDSILSDVFLYRGHKVTDDGWILNSRKTRLIWLPHHWRKCELRCSQSGRFLGLLDGGLPEPIILESGE